jgi:hypothetical protein
LARQKGLVVVDLADEVLVYDLDRHRAHSLNRAAAVVWRHCDGQNRVTEMAGLLAETVALPRDEELVWLVLRRLGKAHLLQERLEPPVNGVRSSRRELMRKLAMIGGVALVSSIIAPKAEATGSACMPGSCVKPGKCCFDTMTMLGFCVTDCGQQAGQCPPTHHTCT